jgi:hypothetical protein
VFGWDGFDGFVMSCLFKLFVVFKPMFTIFWFENIIGIFLYPGGKYIVVYLVVGQVSSTNRRDKRGQQR